MENKKIRRYLAWLLIGVSIIVIGVLGNALIEKGEPTVDQNLIHLLTRLIVVVRAITASKEMVLSNNLIRARIL